MLLATITASALPSLNTVVAAIVVVLATIYGGIGLGGVLGAGGHFAGRNWDEGKHQLFGAGALLAIATLVGTAAFNLGGVGALF
ncbi:MAG: hypothetical protein ACLPYS_10630 [Vulcanimicrobiaceae bacterium]